MAYWALFFTIVGGIFRRILGKTFYIGDFKVSRIYKLIILVLLCISMYFIKSMFPTDWIKLFCMIWAIGWMVRFNNHSHSGMYVLFDGSEFRPKYGWIRWILNKIFGHRNYYHFAGKFIGLTLGYLVPAILASITMSYHWFWLAGIFTPIGYALCEGGLKNEGKTSYAECINGASTFLLFFLNV